MTWDFIERHSIRFSLGFWLPVRVVSQRGDLEFGLALFDERRSLRNDNAPFAGRSEPQGNKETNMKMIQRMKRIAERMALILIALTDASALLLSDLTTPCLLIDVGFLEKQHASASKAFPLPLLRMETCSLVPKLLQPSEIYIQGTEFLSKKDASMPGTCYLHTSVVIPKEETIDTQSLVQLDLPPDLNYKAHLVLGLNNHHVISYYWARSAGAGSSAEAPGVQLVANQLQWSSNDFKDCNSNDGKRSEWVAFLRPKDSVQLVPDEDWQSWQLPVWGVSSRGRPLGSEPAVVCEWRSLD